MKVFVWLSLAIIAIAFAVGAYVYPIMPEIMPSHWNAQGQVDGYLPAGIALFLMPVISLALLALFLILPSLDPLKHNYRGFDKYYNGMILVITLFLFYLYALTIYWALGVNYNMIAMLAPAFALLFFYIGVMLRHVKQNWFVGIKTPWTLSSKEVWEKTHNIGGRLFEACGIIALFAIVFPEWALWLILAPVIVSTIYAFYYSYLQFKKEKKPKEKTGKKSKAKRA
ncbi:MAG: SdpI family protein [archaeon]